VLGVAAGLIGFSFKTVLYKSEDLVDRLWRGVRSGLGRPSAAWGSGPPDRPPSDVWGRLPRDESDGGRQVVLWLLVVLMVGKVVATSLTLLRSEARVGYSPPRSSPGQRRAWPLGSSSSTSSGPASAPAAVFAVVGMGAVFSAAAQAPLTATASVVEMTGNFGLTLPVMLATGIAAAVSKSLSYGSIYTTKLLRVVSTSSARTGQHVAKPHGRGRDAARGQGRRRAPGGRSTGGRTPSLAGGAGTVVGARRHRD